MGSIANGGAEDWNQLTATLKEGERILGPTRRPDGTLRKPIRIRAGYVPQDEVPIYQPPGALWKKEVEAAQEVPPGYDPAVEGKKSKAAKRNERKKEKRQQVALGKGKPSEKTDSSPYLPENVELVTSKMNGLSVSGSDSAVTPPGSSIECVAPVEQVQDIDKKIRALKKKVRLAEAHQQRAVEKDVTLEQSEKLAKLRGWLDELKLLEGKKAQLTTSLS